MTRRKAVFGVPPIGGWRKNMIYTVRGERFCRRGTHTIVQAGGPDIVAGGNLESNRWSGGDTRILDSPSSSSSVVGEALKFTDRIRLIVMGPVRVYATAPRYWSVCRKLSYSLFYACFRWLNVYVIGVHGVKRSVDSSDAGGAGYYIIYKLAKSEWQKYGLFGGNDWRRALMLNDNTHCFIGRLFAACFELFAIGS